MSPIPLTTCTSPLEFHSVELATVASYPRGTEVSVKIYKGTRSQFCWAVKGLLAVRNTSALCRFRSLYPKNEVLYFVHRLPLRSCIRAIGCRFRLNVSFEIHNTSHRTQNDVCPFGFFFRSYNPTSVSSISAAAASSLSAYQSSLSVEASSIISSKSVELSSIASNYSSQISAIRSGYSASFSAASSAAQTQLNPTKTAAAESVTVNAGVFMGIIAGLLAALVWENDEHTMKFFFWYYTYFSYLVVLPTAINLSFLQCIIYSSDAILVSEYSFNHARSKYLLDLVL